ncbi:hypothetical protein Q7P36_005919 [Cladosporium allicinum]
MAIMEEFSNASDGDAPNSAATDEVLRDESLAKAPPDGADGNWVKATSDEIFDPIAIIGCGMRLPGGIKSAEALWQLLDERRDGRCRVPGNRYNVEAFHGPGKPGHVATEYGCFLKDIDLAAFDTSFWSPTRREAGELDPQQRLALEVVAECLENSGTTNWRGAAIGTYIGVFGEDWASMRCRETQSADDYAPAASSDFAIANRISYEFGFRGPSVVIRTACSSSLTGLHQACMDINRGECTSAIVGGTNLIIDPQMTIDMSSRGVLSPDGRCKTFSDDADGYARGEAIVAIHVKRMTDALRDRDPIRAVIRSTSINADGKTAGITQPSIVAHEELMRRSHAVAGISDLSKTAMLECHGTGTAIGDPLEAAAVARVFGEHGVYIGSLKPNLGHAEGASGISSVIKAMLALERRLIPPNINFQKGNRKIPFEESKLAVPTKTSPWPSGKAERIGVNSFGIGGSNAHALLDSAAQMGIVQRTQPTEILNSHYLLTFSAAHPNALQQIAENHGKYLQQHMDRLADLSFTLNVRREAQAHRTFSIVDASCSGKPLVLAPVVYQTETPKVAFVFTGQGAQWAGMGAELVKTHSTFRAAIALMDKALSQSKSPPPWSLQQELLKDEACSLLSAAEYSQPCCTAVQVALVDTLSEMGVTPSSVIGHSSGEIAAAYAAGAITSEEAILIAYHRGLSTKLITSQGGMAAVGLSRRQAESFLTPNVVIGCENGPSSVTLSGDRSDLDEIMEKIRTQYPEVLVRSLKVEHAYHSNHVTAALASFEDAISFILAKTPTTPFVSSVTASVHLEPLDGGYWASNFRSPVLFLDALTELVRRSPPSTLFLEIGPHSALAGPIRQTFKSIQANKATYIPTLKRGQNARLSLLETAGTLFQHGVKIDLACQAFPPGQTLTDLDPYPWQYEGRFWHESRLSQQWRLRKFRHHDLLGAPVREVSGNNPTWRNILRLDEVSWLRDHSVSGDAVFPVSLLALMIYSNRTPADLAINQAAGYIAMAIEGITQLDETSDDFSLREVNFLNALLLYEGAETELLTHFRPERLTTTLDSAWYEFEITSLRDDQWVKHVSGQIRSGPASLLNLPNVVEGPRKVDSPKLYEVLSRSGFQYGPSFRGLQDITACTTQDQAVGVVLNNADTGLSRYALHPAAIDSAMQLFSVSASRGQINRGIQLAVPSYVGEVYIRRTTSDFRVAACATRTNLGSVSGNAVGKDKEGPMLSFSNLKLQRLDEQVGKVLDDNTSPAAVLVWKPDLRFVENPDKLHTMVPNEGSIRTNQTLRTLKHMALACLSEVSTSLSDEGDESSPHHITKYRTWLSKMHTALLNGSRPDLVDYQSVATMSPEERRAAIEHYHLEVSQSLLWPWADAIHRISDNMEDITKGNVTGLEILLQGDLWHNLYNALPTDSARFFELTSHLKPDLKILEIGAGTGGNTSLLLQALKSCTPYHNRGYRSYTFTDITPAFLAAARERFKDYDNMIFETLDITKDPLGQGFEAESYDLIVACNVIHATPDLGNTLRNVRQLLARSGNFYLQESEPDALFVDFVMGPLPGWWLSVDGRSDSPKIPPKQWESLLLAAGFGTATTVYRDGMLNTIVAQQSPPTASSRITVLASWRNHPHVLDLTTALHNKGYLVHIQTWGEPTIAGQDIIAMLDTEEPCSDAWSEERYLQIQRLVAQLDDSGILWITGLSQIQCAQPKYSPILGLARTLREEQGLRIGTLELETFDLRGWETAATVLPEFQRSVVRADTSNSDMEWVWINDRVHVGRFHPVSIKDELTVNSQDMRPAALMVKKPGLFSSLEWERIELGDLQKDSVRIRSVAVGLNFRDVMFAMGLMEHRLGLHHSLGIEVAGVVQEVGRNVNNVVPGDRCVLFANHSLATQAIASESSCVKIPDDMTFAEAATMLCVYCSVVYALMERYQLRSGQTILIHSATGGIGFAAIQISKLVGAEIYCTAGSPEKVQFLVDNHQIPRERIFNSRNLTFKQGIMMATGGRGVDVVLNSLSGELLQASWECVAIQGCMIELGKRDIYGKGKLALDRFEMDRSFICISLDTILAECPWEISRLGRKIMDLYRRGDVKTVMPMTCFEAGRSEAALRYMQGGTHMGKIVITLPEDPKELQIRSTRRKFALHRDASYILVGGLGGIGSAIATWMAESGASEIVFLSPSAEDTERHSDLVRELGSLGCHAGLVAGDVSRSADVQLAVDSATKPIRGLINLAMILKDVSYPDMSYRDWQRATAPKIQGSWNLHHALKSLDLDFFLVTGSVVGIFGRSGQANYAAANSFLDAFVQYRHNLGLTAAAIDLGAFEDIGYVSRDPVLHQTIVSAGYVTLREQDLLDTIQAAIIRCRSDLPQRTAVGGDIIKADTFSSKGQIVLGIGIQDSTLASKSRVQWQHDRRVSYFKSTEKDRKGKVTTKHSTQLGRFLSEAAGNPSVLTTETSIQFLATEIGAMLHHLLAQSGELPALHSTLDSMGVDSLVALELRTMVRQNMGVNISALEISNISTILALGERLAVLLTSRFQPLEYTRSESESAKLQQKFPNLIA